MDTTHVARFADGVTSFLEGERDQLPPEVTGQLEERLRGLRDAAPAHCSSLTREGDLPPPYGDGSARFVVTIRCDEVDRIGVRMGADEGSVRVLGWSERVTR